jgi:hypothetical protein
MGHLWLVYQYYFLPLVLRYISRLHLLSMRPLNIPDDSLAWFFNISLLQIGEQLCCFTIYCPIVVSLINELLEYSRLEY